MHTTEKQKEVSTIDINNAALKLGNAIVETAEYQAYSDAEKRFQNDLQAQALLKKHEEAQQALQLMWRLKSSTEEAMQQVRQIKKLIESNQTLTAYFAAQENLVPLLRELNEFISEKLNMDFSGLSKPQRGCCG
ncbi:MAG: YlbF family regulator [Ignavibacteriales bacterium]|nr:YlbF family regulator [Ignavibacteriales bacterium]